MRINYTVTFEFPLQPPVTHRGTIAASNAANCARKAIHEAKQALRPHRWSSFVFVALERLDDDDEAGDVAPTEIGGESC